jgi:hypothetical protein
VGKDHGREVNILIDTVGVDEGGAEEGVVPVEDDGCFMEFWLF